MRGGDKETIVVANQIQHDEAGVVKTPLDMIARLEQDGARVSTVVLAGSFAEDRELVAFLAESYPALAVVTANDDG